MTATTTPTTATRTTLLSVEHVHAGYGPFRSIFDVSFPVYEGSATALLGPNGCGKTTTARVVTGLVRPTEGTVLLDGQDITGLPAWQVARLGIIHAPEGRSVFSTLTVEENLKLTFVAQLGKRGGVQALHRAYDMFPRLGERRTQVAGTLSGGEQRMVSLARVMANPPRLLVADELSLGLAPVIVDEVFRTLETIRSVGTSLLIVEQHVRRALGLADRAVLLQKGSVVAQGSVAEIRAKVDELLPGSH
jgi:branched-chain amino acid transport system ATP-binding protein